LNIRLLRERAVVLSELLESRWGVTGRVGDLPDAPIWVINATCIETGKNWRFRKREMGDWSFGKHYSPDVPLSVAVAASAAVPYAIGAMPLKLPAEGWWRTDPATNKAVDKKQPLWRTVHLWDGGAYENLGLESLYKPGRSRMLVADLTVGKISGALVRMGNSVRSLDMKADKTRPLGFYDALQPDAEASVALEYPTDLRALTTCNFDRLARHGFEAADTTLTTHSAAEFPQSLRWNETA
jgi:NTE family protein